MLACGNPLLNGSNLYTELWYFADTTTGKDILVGIHIFPPDIDEITMELLQEPANIHWMLRSKKINTRILMEGYILFCHTLDYTTDIG